MKKVAIVGGGPAGLMAAEVLSARGVAVTLFEAMPTVGRKFLLAGKSGLNLTHSEPQDRLLQKFGAARDVLKPALDDFVAHHICDWAASLGIETFTGSSGRIFPRAMKASPLLRSWLARLVNQGVEIRVRHRFVGFVDNGIALETPTGSLNFHCDAVVLALGGASWPKLGSNAQWVDALKSKAIDIAPFRPANCGFDIHWSDVFIQKYEGAPVKSVVASSQAGQLKGEFVISKQGVEGGLIYAHSAALRDTLERDGHAALMLDLTPDRTHDRLTKDLASQKPKDSFATRLRKGAGLDGVKAAMVRECVPEASQLSPETLSAVIKALPLALVSPRPIEEAISCAGGIDLAALDQNYMLKVLPNVFVAGEMLDWEAPTGGYLLTACFATGRSAALGALKYLERVKFIEFKNTL